MKARAQLARTRTIRHQPGVEGAATAQGASAPDPQKDVASQAADAQVETMGEQEPGAFDPAKFKLDVKAAVEGMAPPATLEEADDFEASGKAAGATTTIHGLVTGGRAASEQDIKVATEAPPDPTGKEPKPVSKMVNDAAGGALPEVRAAAALPGRRPPEEIDLFAGPLAVEAKMVEGNITEEQLATANEPEFTSVLDARREVREHAETAPGDYRMQEELVLAQGRAEAESVAATQLEGMHGARTDTLSGVLDAKHATKSSDQQLREGIHQSIVDIHEQTQTDVKAILDSLDTEVDQLFTSGEQAARNDFEEYVDQKMRAYKADRYGGWFGGAYWLKDKLLDLPDEVNDFYRDGRANYLAAMDSVIDVIAVTVGLLLGAAHLRIQLGREQVRAFVAGLDDSVRSLGEDTAADLDNRFDQLASDVDAKRDELVDAVARKYVESRDSLDERIEELKEANKGLVSKAIDAIVKVIKTIYELTKLLLRVLLKAASAIGDIVAHPIRFLESLVGAVKGGLDRFVSRIGDHLQRSLLELLFGELGRAGITMPAQLDFAGILDLVLQVLGLTYSTIRERVVKRFGEPVVARMEQTVDVFTTLVKDGVAGLWTWIREKLADLEDLVVGKIKAYIVDRVVKAGIGYIVALLNPAAAFIKACQGIYQIVMFIVERAKQIAEFVDAILDSIGAIAQGNIGAAIEKIESALGSGLALTINFLARLANLGALSEKVRSIIDLVRKPIMRVVDGIVFGAAGLFRRTVAFVEGKRELRKELEAGKAHPDAVAAEKVKPQPMDREKVEPHTLDGAEADVRPKEVDPSAAPPAGDVIEEPFDVGGEHHEITDDGSGVLILTSSKPRAISDIAALRGLYARYRILQRRGSLAQKKAVIAEMIELLKQNSRLVGLATKQLGDAPNLGEIAPHRSQTPRFLPAAGEAQFARLWELESEHVIPRSYADALFAAFELPGVNETEYRAMHTILIYKGAADVKTEGTGGDNSVYRTLQGATREFTSEAVRTRPSERARARAYVHTTATRLYAQYAANARERTYEAIVSEHDATIGESTHGEVRGRPAAPPAARVDQAFEAQVGDTIGMLDSRLT
jgi:predicted transcriptional regulator